MADDGAEEFAEIALSLHGESTFHDTVERLLEHAMRVVACSHAGVIFVHRRQRVETIGATDARVGALDKVQFDLGEGPDIELIEDRPVVVVRDAAADERWPHWSEQVAAAGLRSMLGIRLYTQDATIGSLNMYHEAPDHFTADDVRVAEVLARHGAVALATAVDHHHLWRAIDARRTIGQAQGILMERYGLDADQACAVLRRHSQDHNVKLHDVAERLIAERDLPH